MPRHPHDKPVTVTIRAEHHEVTCSATLHRGPRFLSDNRMYLLGSRHQMIEAMRLIRGLPLNYEIHFRTDLADDKRSKTKATGVGFMRSIGMASGDQIADESIQTIAEMEILETTESTEAHFDFPLSAEYWFLQRPHNWRVYPRKFRLREQIRRYGDWKLIKIRGIQFRLFVFADVLDDERISVEMQRIELPGIEIKPIDLQSNPEPFFECADEVWSALRVLLTFELRQYISPVRDLRRSSRLLSDTWHTVEIENRERQSGFQNPIYYGQRIETFLSRGADIVLRNGHLVELLHAAAFGYANSFKPLVMEGGLTSCVEGIERLVTAFENAAGLSREVVDGGEWKPTAKSLKIAVSSLKLGKSLDARLKQQLSHAPNLTLEERIKRMMGRYQRHWKNNEKELLRGIERMIKARNDIVHGRLVDPNTTHIELLRAQAIFEKLFLCFCDCGAFETSGHAATALRIHYAAVG